MNVRNLTQLLPAIVIALCLALGTFAGTADARPVPGFEEVASSDTSEQPSEPTTATDPVILEPVRPLFPTVDRADATLPRPAPCGALSPFMLGLTFAALGLVRTTRRAALR